MDCDNRDILFLGVNRMMTTIRRRRKYEAIQAISDLEKRGYKIIYPLTEVNTEGKTFTTDSYNRKIFQNNTFSSSWIAKLKKEGK